MMGVASVTSSAVTAVMPPSSSWSPFLFFVVIIVNYCTVLAVITFTSSLQLQIEKIGSLFTCVVCHDLRENRILVKEFSKFD